MTLQLYPRQGLEDKYFNPTKNVIKQIKVFKEFVGKLILTHLAELILSEVMTRSVS